MNQRGEVLHSPDQRKYMNLLESELEKFKLAANLRHCFEDLPNFGDSSAAKISAFCGGLESNDYISI